MSYIFFSAHIDDALLSCGGLIYALRKQGKKVSVNYVFSRTEWTNKESLSGIFYEKDADKVSALRLKEEKVVSAMMGYDFSFYGFLDKPLRGIETEANGSVLIIQQRDRIVKDITSQDYIFFPLGIIHPDHILLHRVGLDLLEEGYKVVFYEDLPYFSFDGVDVTKIEQEMLSAGFHATLYKIDQQKKIGHLKRYESQMSLRWLEGLTRYSSFGNKGGYFERFWSRVVLV